MSHNLGMRAPLYGNPCHWSRIVRNIGGENPNFGGNVVKTDKCMGVSKILGVRARAVPPKDYMYDPCSKSNVLALCCNDYVGLINIWKDLCDVYLVLRTTHSSSDLEICKSEETMTNAE